MEQKILVVGLESEDQHQLKHRLCEFFSVVDVKETEDPIYVLMKQFRFIKVIVADLSFFQRDDYVFMHEIQRNVILRHLPIICIGQRYDDIEARSADYHEVLRHGGLAFFVPDFDVDAIRMYIDNLICLKDSSHYMNMRMQNDNEDGFATGTLWNPRYLDSIIMQTAMGAVCLIEMLGDTITVLRTNEDFLAEVTGSTDEVTDLELLFDKNLDQENQQRFLKALHDVTENRDKKVQCELTFHRLNQKYENLHVQVSLKLVEQVQEHALIYCVIENDAEKHEALVREAELMSQLQIIIRHFNCGITIAYDDFGSLKYDYSNDQFYSIFGYTKQEFEEEAIDTIRDLVLPEYAFEVKTAMNTARVQMKPVIFVFQARKKDNSIIWVKVRCSVHYVKSRKRLTFIAMYEDITRVKASEDRFKELNEQLADYEVFIQLDLTNKLVEEYHSNYEQNNNQLSVQNRNYQSLLLNAIYEDDRSPIWDMLSFEKLLDSFYAGNTKLTVEYRRHMPNGSIHWFSGTAILVSGGDSDGVNAFLYARDIDEMVKIRMAKDRIMDTEVSDVTLINVASGMCKNIKLYDNSYLDIRDSAYKFEENVEQFVSNEVAAEDRKACREFFRLKHMIPAVEKDGSATISFWIRKTNGINARKTGTVTYLDNTHEELLLVGRDITELFEKEKEQQMALQHAMEMAELANKAKSEFLSRVSHDMRTPLNAILGMTELSIAGNRTPEISEFLKSIDVSSQYLLTLINDTLDLSKIESGKMELHREPFPLSEFILGINTVIKPLMDAKNIQFEMHLKDEMQLIAVDKMRFNQVFYNILSNAAKYTDEGGKVEFFVEEIPPKGDKVGMRFHIRDNGIGMSKEFQKVLFEPFSQEYSKAHKEQKGSGLGLAIVKQIVDLADGQITVNSELDRGTEFIVDLYAYALDHLKEQEPVVRYDLEKLRGLHVLLVDDNEINAQIAQYMLQMKGCLVDVVLDGSLAVERFGSSDQGYYDIILTDIRMPVMDGFEEARRIRALERADAKTVPIVAATADAYDEIVMKIQEAGMNDRLIKPISSKVLYETIVKWVGDRC